jgi:hypothetical protein
VINSAIALSRWNNELMCQEVLFKHLMQRYGLAHTLKTIAPPIPVPRLPFLLTKAMALGLNQSGYWRGVVHHKEQKCISSPSERMLQ